MMAAKQKRQLEILNSAAMLCDHIIADCSDIGTRNNAVALKAVIDLQCGRSKEVIDTMEEILNPFGTLNRCDSVLIMAYHLNGEVEKASKFTQ